MMTLTANTSAAASRNNSFGDKRLSGSSTSGSEPSNQAGSTPGTQHTPAGSSNIVANNSNPFVTAKARSPAQPRGERSLRERSSSELSNSSGTKNPFHKLLHHSDKEEKTPHEHKLRNRAKSLLYMRSANTAAPSPVQPQAHPAKALKRATTNSHVNHMASAGNNVVPSRKHDKIVFNPYGINNGPRLEKPREQSFYLEENDFKNVLPMPIENPNDYLPSDMKELHVDLSDFYAVPERSKTKALGDGASSDVRVVHEIGNKNKKYALKNMILFKGETPERFYKRIAAEYVIAKNVSNGFHIVTTAELLRVPTNGSIHRGWGITMELCDGGDLFSMANDHAWRSVSKDEKFCIFKQIVFGIKYLHEKDIAHIDLKPENVLMTKKGVVKLTDFGISRFAHKVVGDFESPVNYIQKPVGSAPYSPPEMMELDKNRSTLVEPFKVDMWALGVLLSVLFYSKLPFNEASTRDEAYRKYLLSLTSFESKSNPGMKTIGLGPGTDYQLGEKFCSKEASYMCWRLMDPSPTRRYTLKQLFDDPYFQKIKTCTDEFGHLNDGEDDLCDHKRVIEMKTKLYDSSTNTSAESLHKPIKSMLNISGAQAAPAAALSRTSSVSSTSTVSSTSSRISSKHQQQTAPVTASPIRSMLDILPESNSLQQPQPQLQAAGIQASSASLERRKSYDKNAKSPLLRSTSNSSTKSIGGESSGSDSPPRIMVQAATGADDQSSPSSDLPPLEEDEAEKEGVECITVVDTDEEAATATGVNGPNGRSHRSSSEVSAVSSTMISPSANKASVSVMSLPKQRINRDTNLGDNDTLLIDRDHGLIETHCIISPDTLQRCCTYDPKARHRHVDL